MPATARSFFLVFLFSVLGMEPGVLHTLSKHRVTELCPWPHEWHLYSEKEMEMMNTRRIEAFSHKSHSLHDPPKTQNSQNVYLVFSLTEYF